MLNASQKLATGSHKLSIGRYAKAARRRVMITDSKYFRLHTSGRPAGRWCTPAIRGAVAKPKHSIAAHVYMGITSGLKFVSQTGQQIHTHTLRCFAACSSASLDAALLQVTDKSSQSLHAGLTNTTLALPRS